jgi:hypothetical protein
MDTPLRPSAETRETSLARLGSALTRGELDLEEYERRTDLARTTASTTELATLTADLAEDPRDGDRRERQEWFDEWRWWVAGVVVLVGTWGIQSAVDGGPGTFWPGIPLGVWALVLLVLPLLPRGRD